MLWDPRTEARWGILKGHSGEAQESERARKKEIKRAREVREGAALDLLLFYTSP